MPEIEMSQIQKTLFAYTAKRNSLAVSIFLLDMFIYGGLISSTLYVEPFWLKIILSILTGLSIALLFVVGHDACHNSFTTTRKKNKIIGVIAFMPSLHNFSLWDLGHNKIHHGNTSLKTVDYVYAPLSENEFYSLSYLKKIQYKIYRSSLGHGFYYLFELWLKKLFIPIKSQIGSKKVNKYWEDILPILIYIMVLFIVIVFFGSDIWLDFITVFLIPFLVWNWIMGFAIYQHHTSMLSKWYSSKDEWEYWEVQLKESIHIVFPKPINFLLHNIMEHTAHHINANIPLYNLSDAQRVLERHYGSGMKIIKWNVKYYKDSVKECKLYNYETHTWSRFPSKK